MHFFPIFTENDTKMTDLAILLCIFNHQRKNFPIIPTTVITALVRMMGLSPILIPAASQRRPPSICRYQPTETPELNKPNPQMRMTVAGHFKKLDISSPLLLFS